jgi:hypothetical protein
MLTSAAFFFSRAVVGAFLWMEIFQPAGFFGVLNNSPPGNGWRLNSVGENWLRV